MDSGAALSDAGILVSLRHNHGDLSPSSLEIEELALVFGGLAVTCIAGTIVYSCFRSDTVGLGSPQYAQKWMERLFPALLAIGSLVNVLPQWATGILFLIAGLWLAYSFFWSKAAARRMACDHQTLQAAGYPAQLEANAEILVYLAFIPIVGKCFHKEKNSKKK